jgi:hypothetical protein
VHAAYMPHVVNSAAATIMAHTCRFKSAGGTVVGGADKEAFQAGVQGLHYEGPASLQVGSDPPSAALRWSALRPCWSC